MINLFRRWYQRHFSQPGTIEFAMVLLCVFLTVYYLMWLVGPLVVALCLAFCLDWPVNALEKAGLMGRRCASVFVMILFCSLVVLITVLLIPKIIKQGISFYDTVISLSREAAVSIEQNHASDAAERGIGQAMESGTDIVIKVTESGEGDRGFAAFRNAADEETTFRLDITDYDTIIARELYGFIATLPEPVPSLLPQDSVERAVRQSRIRLSNQISNFAKNRLGPSVFNLVTWSVYLIIVPIFTFLMLYNKEDLQRRFRLFILPNNQVLLRRFWPSIHGQIAGYIRGKLLHIIIISIANSMAFALMDVNFALILGIGVGLSVVIPYVGAVIIAVPVVIVTVFQFGLSSTFMWILLIYTVIQLLDSNVLTPMLFSKAMNLDAFSILTAILIFGGLWGFWGVFFAIPLATFIKTIVVQWPNEDLRRMQKQERLLAIKQRNAAQQKAQEQKKRDGSLKSQSKDKADKDGADA